MGQIKIVSSTNTPEKFKKKKSKSFRMKLRALRSDHSDRAGKVLNSKAKHDDRDIELADRKVKTEGWQLD